MATEEGFAPAVYALVAQIPRGRVMTYGQIAALCGSPRAARIVGGVAHYGPEDLPWHRVVNKQGGLARAFPGGRSEQAARLAEEGVSADSDYRVDIDRLIWWPPETAKFVAIVGPTATGKTALGIRLAERFGGEIVCVDSRTLYRGMNIGTAKPTAEEQARIPHHLIDILNPGERLSAAVFKQLAQGAMAEIVARGRVPFLVGGSGLYADAVLFDYNFPPEANPELRERLEAMSHNDLLELLAAEDPKAYARVDSANRRRVIRAIETAGERPGRSATVRPEALVLGVSSNKEIVQKRVTQRVEKMLEEGFIEEVRTVGETYGWDSPALEVIGYRAFKDYVLGTKSLEDAKADVVRGDMALYKKQVTWFKRNPAIKWVEDASEAEALTEAFLASN